MVQVLIPTDVDASVPDWVFERSPAELKAAVAAARRRREQGEVSPVTLTTAAPMLPYPSSDKRLCSCMLSKTTQPCNGPRAQSVQHGMLARVQDTRMCQELPGA